MLDEYLVVELRMADFTEDGDDDSRESDLISGTRPLESILK
jgi:hypothetical protein